MPEERAIKWGIIPGAVHSFHVAKWEWPCCVFHPVLCRQVAIGTMHVLCLLSPRFPILANIVNPCQLGASQFSLREAWSSISQSSSMHDLLWSYSIFKVLYIPLYCIILPWATDASVAKLPLILIIPSQCLLWKGIDTIYGKGKVPPDVPDPRTVPCHLLQELVTFVASYSQNV